MTKPVQSTPTFAARTRAPVAIVRTSPEHVFDDVRKAMELAEWRRYITPGADVALKPNLGWDKLVPGAISAPWVVEGVILTIKDYVSTIYMVESDQVVVDVEDALRLTRLDEVCHRHDVEWVNMSKGKFVRMHNPSQLALHKVHIPEILTRTELITLPLLKTHNKSTITGAIKNQWGCLETLRHNFHPVLSKALVDVNLMVQPRFAVMDGTVGLQGNGPKSGIPREMNLILASANLVGLDSTAAQVMGFDPTEIDHLRLCADHGLGSLPGSYEVVGERITEVAGQFISAKHNAVSWLELLLRQSVLSYLVFQTPLLKLFTWGARRYYDWWDWTVGRKLRKEFFANTRYKRQWFPSD